MFGLATEIVDGGGLMQEATIALIMAVASILGAVGMGARLLLNRMKRMEKEDELRRAAEQKELKALRERVADLEVKAKRVPILESQVCTLLTEMSTLQQRVREVSDELAAERDNKARLERELTDTRAERDQLRIEKRDWETARATYDHALTLLGLERTEHGKAHKTARADGGEQIGDSEKAGETVSAPEPGEGEAQP